MRLHEKQQIEKCTENTLLKLRYKINRKFSRHVIEQFFVLNVILHRLKITLLDSHDLLIKPTLIIYKLQSIKSLSSGWMSLSFQNRFLLYMFSYNKKIFLLSCSEAIYCILE